MVITVIKMKQVKVACVVSRLDDLDVNNPRLPMRYFFFDALPRYKHIDIDFIEPCGSRLDVAQIADDYDVILLPGLTLATVLALKGVREQSIPVIARADDPHTVLHTDVVGRCIATKVDHLFNHVGLKPFYKYYPAHFNYTQIPFGVEPSLYKTNTEWDSRVEDQIVVSGAMDRPGLMRFLYYRVYQRRPAALSPNHHYNLRTRCLRLPYVIHAKDIAYRECADQMPVVLGMFRAAIAATTQFTTIKYTETPAAGCLTFMEVTENNQADTLGYRDGETAIFINNLNYREKFQEYLNNTDNGKWQRIAEAGREYTLKNLTNDTAAEKIYQLMLQLLGECAPKLDDD